MTEKRNSPHDPELSREEVNFARRAGGRLSDSADALDAATLSRLNRARQRALEQLPDRHRTRTAWWLPAGAVAVTATVALGLSMDLWETDGPARDGGPAFPGAAGEFADVDLLLDDGDLEMIEDLEFFAWLATDASMQAEAT
jgi:hypothetical protein